MQLKNMTLTAFVLCLFSVSSLAAADQAPAKHGAEKGNKANSANIIGRLNQRSVRIGKRIDKLNDRVAQHPKCPDNIKADVTKLTGDLATQQNNIGTLVGCLQKKDKDAAKAQHAVIKAQRAVIQADCQQLKTDRQACKATRQVAGGGGEGKAARKGQGKRQGKGQGEGRQGGRQGHGRQQQ